MSAAFGASQTTQKAATTQSSQQDPWAPAVPALKDLLGNLTATSKANPAGITPQQQAAGNQLQGQFEAGNPYASQIDQLTGDLFATPDRAGAVTGAYGDLERRLSPTADGANQAGVGNNPHLQAMLDQAGNAAADAARGRFASAGRDFSGYEQQAVARGVAQAQTPIMFDQFNRDNEREQGRTDSAARDLYGASVASTKATADLDALRGQLRASGIDVGNAALSADQWGPTQILQLQESMKQMPYDDLKRVAEILFPAAGLGGSMAGTGTSQSKGTTFGGQLGMKFI